MRLRLAGPRGIDARPSPPRPALRTHSNRWVRAANGRTDGMRRVRQGGGREGDIQVDTDNSHVASDVAAVRCRSCFSLPSPPWFPSSATRETTEALGDTESRGRCSAATVLWQP